MKGVPQIADALKRETFVERGCAGAAAGAEARRPRGGGGGAIGEGEGWK